MCERYNRPVLKLRNISCLVSSVFLLQCFGLTQAQPHVGQTVLVVPFENQSKAPGIEWVGDSFPELLRERLDSPTLYVVPTEDRIRAYDRLGIPVYLRASRATIYRVAEQLDVDYVVLGHYSFDGQTFTATVQLLDMHREHLLPDATESAQLVKLIDAETAVAWDVLHALHPEVSATRQQYVEQAAPVRLDAFENYIRGVTAATNPEQIRYFREAARLSPSYTDALLQLGKAYYRDRQYAESAAWLSRVPENDARAGEASFYLGLAAYSEGNFARSESAFNAVATRLPLSEVYNNLGVAVDHRDPKAAVEYFEKAVTADPSEPDYRFNLGVGLYRAGDVTGASKQLREGLALRPGDSEAKALLETLPTGAVQGWRGQTGGANLPAERLRTSYDEASFRLLLLKIDAAAEQKLAKTDPRTHSRFHNDRGHQLLQQGFLAEAKQEFDEAISLNPENADPHAGLASVLEAMNQAPSARSEAQEALRLRQFAEPLVVLARLDLRDNKPDRAAQEIDQALRLEPNNASAKQLKQAVMAKTTHDNQSLKP